MIRARFTSESFYPQSCNHFPKEYFKVVNPVTPTEQFAKNLPNDVSNSIHNRVPRNGGYSWNARCESGIR